MRIRKVSIDGYGRFAGRVLEFAPGLQVIVGPNEQGKSTVRCFIGDMLFGQKRSAVQRLYDEANELRTPWDNPDCYGGSLTYFLDDGAEIEVVRNFDRRRESIQIYDRTNAREITGDFDRLRNREVSFAAAHLGLTKDVFLGTATISHASLDDLGERDALNQIREKLLSLADSGEESHSAEATLALLAARVTAIGQPNARTKPLPVARARARELDQELQRGRELQRELADMGEQRRMVLDEIESLRERRLAVDEALGLLEAHERANRLRQAEGLRDRIDTATQHCFALGAARDFPQDRAEEIQTAATRAATAEAQRERTQVEAGNLAREQQREEARLEDTGALRLEEVPEELEAQLNDTQAQHGRATERAEEAEALVLAAEDRFEDSQEAVAALPDFHSFAADPVELITQLASSFGLALRSRDEEREVHERLREEIRQREEALAASEDLFKDRSDFPEQAREYELAKRMHREQLVQRSNYLYSLQGTREETAENLPQLLWLAAGCSVGMVALLIAGYFVWKPPILMPIGLLGFAILYFLIYLFISRGRLQRLTREITETEAELEVLEKDDEIVSGPIEELLAQTGFETVRELEAQYEQYRESAAVLADRRQVLTEQQGRTQETAERVPLLLERLRETFGQIGEAVEDAEDVQRAAGSAIARYQEFRETKRRMTDSRAVLERHREERERLMDLLLDAEAQMSAIEEAVVQWLRAHGFEDNEDGASAAAALRAYTLRAAQYREVQGRIALLAEKREALGRQLAQEEEDAAKQASDLESRLRSCGVASMAEWNAMLEQAKEYREVWAKRNALEEQLEAVLQGADLDTLRAEAEAAGTLASAPSASRDDLKAESASVEETIDGASKEAHALHIKMTERGAGLRSLNEVEEERAALDRRLQDLEQEHAATSYAMALIEDIARDKHARIAPKLAARASEILADITDSAYDELLLSRDLNISIRIPQTRRMNERPEQTLSRGTVDQIYLALRLALVQGISGTGESIPMLLDDPFANYDDSRLARTMKLISRIGEDNQILVFTCREDVVRAAKTIGAPVIRL